MGKGPGKPGPQDPDRALVDNAADAEQVKKARKREKERRREEIDDLRQVLETDAGKRLIWRYLKMCNLYTLSFHSDPHMTSFNEGERNVGLAIVRDLEEAAPTALFELGIFNEKAGPNP